MMTEVSTEELHEHLKEQLEFLERSAYSYDSGFEGEIKRLAVTVRILVHDTGNSTSLLTHLHKKDIDFIDTSLPYNDNNLLTHSGLVQISRRNNSSKALPFLDDGPFSRKTKFDLWWNGIVLVDKHKNEFSRRDIVLSLANKEGGAHVDKKLDKKYADLRKNNSLGWFEVSSDGIKTPLSDQVPATMRQIAHEVLKTLKEGYSCHRDKNIKHDLIFMGGSIVKGDKLPSLQIHNLPKNRRVINGRKIGRNDPCSCGSGMKYKKCCLRLTT